jgi:hypothetical protein
MLLLASFFFRVLRIHLHPSIELRLSFRCSQRIKSNLYWRCKRKFCMLQLLNTVRKRREVLRIVVPDPTKCVRLLCPATPSSSLYHIFFYWYEHPPQLTNSSSLAPSVTIRFLDFPDTSPQRDSIIQFPSHVLFSLNWQSGQCLKNSTVFFLQSSQRSWEIRRSINSCKASGSRIWI